MKQIIPIFLLFYNCVTLKVIELSDGKKEPKLVERIDSISFDKLDAKYLYPIYKIQFNGISSTDNSYENCYNNKLLFKCDANSDWMEAEIKEIKSMGGLHLSYSNYIFLNKKLKKLYRDQVIILNHNKPEIYATLDGKAFLSKLDSTDFRYYCPNQNNCNLSNQKDFELKLEKLELSKGNLLVILDKETNVKKMYFFTFPNINKNFINEEVIIISTIDERKKNSFYYLLIPFSVATDIISSPILFIYYFYDFITGFRAYRALG